MPAAANSALRSHSSIVGGSTCSRNDERSEMVMPDLRSGRTVARCTASVGQTHEDQDPAFKFEHLHGVQVSYDDTNIGASDGCDLVDHDEAR